MGCTGMYPFTGFNTGKPSIPDVDGNELYLHGPVENKTVGAPY